MGEIRKQSIFSSIIIYFGFVFGAINTYLYTKEGFFDPSQYGLTQAMISMNQVFYAFASLGVVSVMSRFYPYYYDELKDDDNDLLAASFTFALIGFGLVLIGGWLLKPYFIKKFLTNAPQLVDYYSWLFPFVFFFLIYNILDAQSTIHKRTVFPSFLKEGMVRIITTVLIVLYLFKLISFDTFIKLFACIYFFTALMLYIYLRKYATVKLVFRLSAVTRRKGKDMLQFVLYVFGGLIIFTLAQQIDSISISAQKGMKLLGVYSLAQYIATVVQVPQRGLISIATPFLSQAWKDHNLEEIDRIYKRSSLNLLLISLFLFFAIWLNIDNAFDVLPLDPAYRAGKWVVLILGISKIVDMGTGINSQLLYTSPSWKFEFVSGLILLAISLPLNYYLVKYYDIEGAAFSTLVSIGIYNLIRILFIYRKYQMQPFSVKNLWCIFAAVIIYGICYFLFQSFGGWTGIFLRSAAYTILFVTAVVWLDLTPDWRPVWAATVKWVNKKRRRKT